MVEDESQAYTEQIPERFAWPDFKEWCLSQREFPWRAVYFFSLHGGPVLVEVKDGRDESEYPDSPYFYAVGTAFSSSCSQGAFRGRRTRNNMARPILLLHWLDPCYCLLMSQHMESEFVADVRRSAEESFEAGLYCAESVLLALAKAQGLETDVLPKVATAFCSGMARTCGTCGALTGAVMGVSLALGRGSAAEPVEPSYEATQELVRQFEQQFGARNCNDLLGCDLGTEEGQDRFRVEGLHLRCAKYTSKAAEIAAGIIWRTRLPD